MHSRQVKQASVSVTTLVSNKKMLLAIAWAKRTGGSLGLFGPGAPFKYSYINYFVWDSREQDGVGVLEDPSF